MRTYAKSLDNLDLNLHFRYSAVVQFLSANSALDKLMDHYCYVLGGEGGGLPQC